MTVDGQQKILDAERLKRTYAFHSLLLKDARLAFGSEWTVAPLSPVEGIYAAVTRRTLDEKKRKDGFLMKRLKLK